MAIIFMDSFDHYTKAEVLNKWSSSALGANNSGIGAGGRFGNCVYFGDWYASYLIKNIETHPRTMIVGFAFYQTGPPNGDTIFGLYGGGTLQCKLTWVSATSSIKAWTATTDRGAVAIIPSSSWVYIEVKAYIDNAGGTFEVRVSGTPVLVLSGIDTQAHASINYIDQVMLGRDNPSGVAFNSKYDDCYMCDTTGSVANDFLGDTRIEYLAPTGAGVRTQFTPSTGSNWQNVDESPASDADYNSNNSPGAMDLFQMANLSVNGLVHGVQTISRAKKDDAGFRKALPVFYKASGLGDTARFYKGSQAPVLDSFTNLPIQVMTTSPDTGVAWTVDEVNALQYGYAVGDAGMFTLDAKVV